MKQKETFLGPIQLAPAKAQHMVGSLIPLGKNAAVTVLFVPAGARWGGKIIECADRDTHLLLLAEEGAHVTTMLHVTGTEERRHATEIIVRDGAHCHITTLQECGAGSRLTMREEVRIGSDAIHSWHTRAFGAGNIDHELRSRVMGTASRSDVLWTCMAFGAQQRSIRAENIFEASRGKGEMILKGIARDHAFVRVMGKIVIGENGSGTDTYLTQEVLMLDPTAQVDAVPALEIKTNDVKASHAASVRRITEEELFYFGARGIPLSEARDLYVRGFLGMAQEEGCG